MTGKRKASDDAPGSSRPPPSQRGVETYDEGSTSTISDSSGDSRRTIQDEEGYSSFDVDDVGGGESNERSEAATTAANMLLGLSLKLLSRVRSESSQPAAAEARAHSPPPADHGQLAEMEVQPPAPPPSPTDQSVPAAEVSDQSVKAASPEPELVASDPESVVCLGCGREPPFWRLLPVRHACLCLLCLTDPSGTAHCEICDRPRR